MKKGDIGEYAVKENESLSQQLLDKAQKILDEAQANLSGIKEEIDQNVVFKNEKTKQAWLKLSGLGDVDVDEDGAVALLEERVKDGDGEAMWMLGVCNEYGLGTEQNIKRAEDLYKQSSDGGNVIGKWCGRLLMKMKSLQMKNKYNDFMLNNDYDIIMKC